MIEIDQWTWTDVDKRKQDAEVYVVHATGRARLENDDEPTERGATKEDEPEEPGDDDSVARKDDSMEVDPKTNEEDETKEAEDYVQDNASLKSFQSAMDVELGDEGEP